MLGLGESVLSVNERIGNYPKKVVEVIAQRYIGQNPAIPFQYRAFNRKGILQDSQGRFNMDMNIRYPHAEIGDYAYVLGQVWSDDHRAIDVEIICLGWTEMYLNNEVLYKSPMLEESTSNHMYERVLKLEPGYNAIFIKVKKTAHGFGCYLGSKESIVRLFNVLAPFKERYGQTGWVYSQLCKEDHFPKDFPRYNEMESKQKVCWYPQFKWEKDNKKLLSFDRLFGMCEDSYAYGWTKFKTRQDGIVNLKVKSYGKINIYINNELVELKSKQGSLEADVLTKSGENSLVIESVCADKGWGVSVNLTQNGEPIDFSLPFDVKGASCEWLYLGPFKEKVCNLFEQIGPYNLINEHYWQLDMKDTWVRPYYENGMLSNGWVASKTTNYGRWDYPLGVTLRGLLHAGKILERFDIVEYVKGHTEVITLMYQYAKWDDKQYGFPSVNHQLVRMKMLDHCGSYGATLLELMESTDVVNGSIVSNEISDFISNVVERTEDQAFYRLCEGEYLERTMWADDLYMSVPFLVNYYKHTKDLSYLNDATLQFLKYKDYLYIDHLKVMSHVYDFKCNAPTLIPWGRGNGWCFFSLSVLLETLQPDSEHYDEICDFFVVLCNSYIDLQSNKGLWHQVLTEDDSYLETSCTAMFIYGLCKAIELGLATDVERYTKAIELGWQGLSKYSIDEQGNIYGVCRGSMYSFSSDYYKNELLPVINDNHGIGIVLLASIEYLKLKELRESDVELKKK